jgi:NitT/TauT family transport system substrate-binding protein
VTFGRWPWRSALALAALCPLLAAGIASAASAPPNSERAPALASSECAANKAAGTVRFASPFGYDASAGIIDVYAAIKLGYFKDLCLAVQFLDAPPGESYALVSAGSAQVTGEGSAADALVAEANGDNFVGISTFGDVSDYVLLTRKSITNLKMLEGKVLAFHPPVLPVVLHEMLVKAGVDLAKVTVVSDTTYDPQLLIHGSYYALQGYESNEPITLRADHEPFNMWTPAQFGVSGTFNVQVVNRNFLSAHPTAAADFLRAELRAFDYCARHVATCVGYLAKAAGPTFDVAHYEAEWRLESTLAEQHHLAGLGIGVQTTAEWGPEAKAVYQDKLVRKPVDLAADEDTAVAASLYHGTTLVWP